jgi:hypothetical protein
MVSGAVCILFYWSVLEAFGAAMCYHVRDVIQQHRQSFSPILGFPKTNLPIDLQEYCHKRGQIESDISPPIPNSVGCADGYVVTAHSSEIPKRIHIVSSHEVY